MTRAQGAVLAALLAALVLVQHVGLEAQPAVQAENRLKQLPDVKARDMVPTYVASLFFGAFRTVAIDILWIQLKKAEDERRWYERRDILQMISYVQPRNPEVWSHLGWHSAYNVANGFTDEKKQWEWIRFGLTWLRRGIRMIPENAHLKMELGYTLLHKPGWREVQLDLPLLRRIEADVELQKFLLPDHVRWDGRSRSAFELARLWLEGAREDIARGGTTAHKTQMGLMIYQSSMDGYIRRALYLEAIRAWQAGDHAAAAAKAQEVHQHVAWMLEKEKEGKYREHLSDIFHDWKKFYAKLPAAIELHGRAEKSKERADELEALRALQGLFADTGYLLDEGYLWTRGNPTGIMTTLKRRLTDAKDDGECNDVQRMGWALEPNKPASATLAPAGLDVDWYWLSAEAPPPPRGAPPPPPADLKIELRLARPAGAATTLRATLFDLHERPLKVLEFKGEPLKVQVKLPEYGTYSLKVEPLDPAAADTRYTVEYGLLR